MKKSVTYHKSSKFSHNSLEKLPFLQKESNIFTKVLYKSFHIHFFQLYPRFTRMFSTFACNGPFMTFEFFWLTTISPRNAPLGSSQWRKMVKAYSVLFFITDNIPAVVWLLVCCKAIFDEDNSFRLFGWVQKLLINLTLILNACFS